jgi:hypothetical protein
MDRLARRPLAGGEAGRPWRLVALRRLVEEGFGLIVALEPHRIIAPEPRRLIVIVRRRLSVDNG